MPKDFVDGGVRDFPGASIHPGNRAASELSSYGAITAGEYGEAHALYGRKTRGDGNRHE